MAAKHCLVVDDSRVIRKVACSLLDQFGFDTGEAEDGAGALEACRARMPELILLDWSIPSSSSAEFLRQLRREREGERPVVLFCTTENDVMRINEAMLAGANDYVLKPFDRPSLEEKLIEAGLL